MLGRIPGRPRRFWQPFLAVVDQAIFGGSRFLVTLILGRLAGLEELGLFAMGFTCYLLASNTQQALVHTPLAVFLHRTPISERAERIGSAVLHFICLSAVASLAMLALAIGFSVTERIAGLDAVLFTLTFALPALLLRDLWRGIGMAEIALPRVLALDVAYTTLVVIFLVALHYAESLSAVYGHLAVGIASALAVVGCIAFLRPRTKMSVHTARQEASRSWAIGRYVWAAQTAFLVRAYAMHWILGLYVSAESAGIFAAVEAFVLLPNPLVRGFANYFTPAAAKVLVERGKAQLAQMCKVAGLLLALLLSITTAVFAFFGDDLATLAYGPEFAGNGAAITSFAVFALLEALSIPLTAGLSVLERAQSIARAATWSVIVTLACAVPLLGAFGVAGAAQAMAIGAAVALGIELKAFYSALNQD